MTYIDIEINEFLINDRRELQARDVSSACHVVPLSITILYGWSSKLFYEIQRLTVIFGNTLVFLVIKKEQGCWKRRSFVDCVELQLRTPETQAI